MGKSSRRRHVAVEKEVWQGYKHLAERYNASMIDIARAVFDSSDLEALDGILSVRRRRHRK